MSNEILLLLRTTASALVKWCQPAARLIALVQCYTMLLLLDGIADSFFVSSVTISWIRGLLLLLLLLLQCVLPVLLLLLLRVLRWPLSKRSSSEAGE